MIGERTGEGSGWIERAREAKRELEKALNQEKEQLAKLPYSESQLEKALQDLAKQPPGKKAPTVPPPSPQP
jgi:ABC-type protease/lipase transport system fused ATPase/permease subunit